MAKSKKIKQNWTKPENFLSSFAAVLITIIKN